MANLRAVSGSKIYIGTKVAKQAVVTLADFTPQVGSWLEVDGWTAAGALGETTEIISQTVINLGRTLSMKGPKTSEAMENTFLPDLADPGQIRMRSAVDSCKPFAFKIEWGAGCIETGTVTIPVATPGVVNWADGHGLDIGSPVTFSAASGTLPTGLSAGTTYYVIAAGYTATSFQISATPGGSPVSITGAGTATVITATGQPAGETDMFYGYALPGARQGGEANAAQLRSWSIQPYSNIITV